MVSLEFFELNICALSVQLIRDAFRAYFVPLYFTTLNTFLFQPQINDDKNLNFAGAFAKLIKATISFIMSVCPSLRNNSALYGRIFLKFDI